jgi:acyl carrier protein
MTFLKQMNTEDIANNLKSNIVNLLNRPEIADEISDQTELFNMGMDSVILVSLVVQIEQEFEIFFEDEELVAENFQTIELIVERIIEKMN